jgi:transcriptional regulator with XRE-family HTH domain
MRKARARTWKKAHRAIGARLAELRRERGSTRREIASRAGISHRMLVAYETEGVVPPASVLPGLSAALGVGLEELFAGIEQAAAAIPTSEPAPRKRGRKSRRTPPAFGGHLAELRRQAGLTQRELGAAIGVAQATVAYYETQSANPPVALVPAIAKALGVRIEQLFNGADAAAARSSVRLAKRLQSVEALPPRERRKLTQVIDAFLEREALKRGSSQTPSRERVGAGK